MPDQREGANKQAEKRHRAVSQLNQALLDMAFIGEYQIQRPKHDAQHNQNIGYRADLHVDLVGDNRHRDQNAVANQAA
ncbi:hypothetical protein D3C75_662240 [compost metagenome]